MIQHINSLIFKLLQLFVFYSLFTFSIVQNIQAEDTAPKKDTMDTIIDILSQLTCETQGVGDLLRSEFSHTCIPASFFSYAIANIVSPGLYATTLLHLKINDHELFDDLTYESGPNVGKKIFLPGGQCSRGNRAEADNPELTFALCSNAKLALYQAKAITKAALAIAKAVLTGEDPWDDIKDLWKDGKKEYHEIKTRKDGDSDTMVDVPPIWWKVEKIEDRICLTTVALTLSGNIAVGCKYIKEPYPTSIYYKFISLAEPKTSSIKTPKIKKGPTDPTALTEVPSDPKRLVECGLMGEEGSCYQRAYNASKAAVVISAPLIECIKEMTARLLINRNVCSFDSINFVMDATARESSALFQFQRNMHKIVTAFLTIYVILFGFKIVLAGEAPPKSELINFVIKIIFVTYFSIGLNITAGSKSDYNRLDGMTQHVFPLLLNGISELAGWVMSASPSGLCNFSTDIKTDTKVHYDSKISYISLWDSLDCHIAHYLGLDIISTLLVENASRNQDFSNFDFFSFSAPPYVYLLIPAIISGNMNLISLALSYPLLVISVGAFMINATVMCMISIVILGVLAPLFVPMLLFQYTKGYFESWVKLLISFLLQPMVVTTFMIMMFSVYDLGFYGKCQYSKTVIKDSVENKAQGGGAREIFIFYVNNNWKEYKNEDDIKSCKNSLGYMLNNPLATVYDFTADNLKDMVPDGTKKGTVSAMPGTVSTDKSMSKYTFLSGIVMGPGMFFVSPKLLFEKIKDIVLALITACFTLYLMYHFSEQLANFAADMTEGVSLASVTIKPQAIFKAGMAALSAAGQSADKSTGAGRAGDKAAGGSRGSGDSVANGESSRDSVAGGESSGDSVSTEGRSGISSSAGVSSAAGKVEGQVKEEVEGAASSGASEGASTSDSGTGSRRNDDSLISTSSTTEEPGGVDSQPSLVTSEGQSTARGSIDDTERSGPEGVPNEVEKQSEISTDGSTNAAGKGSISSPNFVERKEGEVERREGEVESSRREGEPADAVNVEWQPGQGDGVQRKEGEQGINDEEPGAVKRREGEIESSRQEGEPADALNAEGQPGQNDGVQRKGGEQGINDEEPGAVERREGEVESSRQEGEPADDVSAEGQPGQNDGVQRKEGEQGINDEEPGAVERREGEVESSRREGEPADDVNAEGQPGQNDGVQRKGEEQGINDEEPGVVERREGEPDEN